MFLSSIEESIKPIIDIEENESNNDTLEAVVTKKKAKQPKAVSSKPKKAKVEKPKKLSAREKEIEMFPDLKFSDADGEYDVPVTDAPMWFRLQVRKNSEKRFLESIANLYETNPAWKEIITDVYYPSVNYVKFKGKAIEIANKPMIPGTYFFP